MKTTISVISTIIVAFLFVCYVIMLIEGRDQSAFAFLIALTAVGLIPITIFLMKDEHEKDTKSKDRKFN